VEVVASDRREKAVFGIFAIWIKTPGEGDLRLMRSDPPDPAAT
jgi:hypothetical protein